MTTIVDLSPSRLYGKIEMKFTWSAIKDKNENYTGDFAVYSPYQGIIMVTKDEELANVLTNALNNRNVEWCYQLGERGNF